MIKDRWVSLLLDQLKKDIEVERDALELCPPDEVKEHRGALRGIRQSIQRLEGVLEDEDK